jgi:hypothetical protein
LSAVHQLQRRQVEGVVRRDHSANSAQTKQTSAMAAASIATGELRKECQTSPSKKARSAGRGRRVGVGVNCHRQGPAPDAQARIDREIQQVHARLMTTKISEIRHR